jgi:hypothetical protein
MDKFRTVLRIEKQFSFFGPRILVSTVYLAGIPHGEDDRGRPLVYETMVFNGKHDGYQQRYATEDEAIVGHMRVMEMISNKW